MQCRLLMPRQSCSAFTSASKTPQAGIVPIYVINLDRQPKRWADMVRELDGVLDAVGQPLSERAIRYSACDARSHSPDIADESDLDPFYTLSDQLFVEPQPLAVPDEFDLERPIKMSEAEVAVATSHIGVWRTFLRSGASYALVLEDDVWFERGLGLTLEKAWREMEEADPTHPLFDVLYVSYSEVRHGAPKETVSKNVFRPERGLWYLSGYILSRSGAQALLSLLPCRGPIDLWINQKYPDLKVRALRRSMVNQRRDLSSTNLYSILPALSGLGILNDGDAALFHQRPLHVPVFAFGAPGSGLSSLAMALSMLGYRCCSDLDSLPKAELDSLLEGRHRRVFDAYVNIENLERNLPDIGRKYPDAKYIVLSDLAVFTGVSDAVRTTLTGSNINFLRYDSTIGWRALCEYLRLAPPDAPYPCIKEIGLRKTQSVMSFQASTTAKPHIYDRSPWIVPSDAKWDGIAFEAERLASTECLRMRFEDDFTEILSQRWHIRNDTFPGNLGIFRPANVTQAADGGLSLAVIEESHGVRNFSAAALSSRERFHFGRFEVTLRAADVPGLVTGFFLYRDSPRQEIDVEILGSRPQELLVNVFYNPGSNGSRFNYGYRGTPAVIKLGFDASKAAHQFALEWTPSEIRWFVDQKLVHVRKTWGPTPIPQLPMTLHVNTWPARSREFAGRLDVTGLPASTTLHRVVVDADC